MVSFIILLLLEIVILTTLKVKQRHRLCQKFQTKSVKKGVVVYFRNCSRAICQKLQQQIGIDSRICTARLSHEE